MENIASSSLKCTCEICESTFSKKYNYQRHMLMIHGIDKNHTLEHEIRNEGGNTNLCPHCFQTFQSKWYLSKHIEKCSGKILQFSCEQCQKKFKDKKSIYRHRTICKGSSFIPMVPSKIIKNTTPLEQPITKQNEKQTIIVTYNPSRIIFNKEHLNQVEFMDHILQTMRRRINHNMILDYARKILVYPENKCIQKKYLKEGYSKVHIGDNQWSMKLDQTIYPHLASILANELSELININRELFPMPLFTQLISFLDYMADEGYINTDNQEQQKIIKREFSYLVRELKLIIYDITHGSIQ